MIKIAINGILGKMGSMVTDFIFASDDFILTGGIENSKHPAIGKRIKEIRPDYKTDIEICSDYRKALHDCEIIIDFSAPQGTESLVDYLIFNPIPLVCGTTGLPSQCHEKIHALSQKVPVVYSPNMSIGINVLFWLGQTLAPILKDNFDIEISEIHHKNKQDAPSGTALKLGELIAKKIELNLTPNKWGQRGARDNKELGISFLRGGDVVGEHNLYFLGNGERLIINHQATTRAVFVQGTLRAVRFLINQHKNRNYGLFSMLEVLGLN